MPKARAIIANTAIVAAAVIGGVVLTNHYTESSGGLAGAFGMTDTASAGTSGSGANSNAEQKATGDAIQYPFGVIQLEVVKQSGKITAVNLVQASATAGREQAFSYLQQYAVQANGSSFGNLSGATYTTDTFKQALDSALSKLN